MRKIQDWPVLLQSRCNGVLMKPNSAAAPALMPEIGLHASAFLGGGRSAILGCTRRFVGYFVLLRKPRPQIDQSATIAAERAISGFGRPRHRATALRTFDDRGHALSSFAQAQQVKRNGVSLSTCTGRLVASSQLRNRIVQRCWLPLISGNKSVLAGKLTRTSWQGCSRSNCS